MGNRELRCNGITRIGWNDDDARYAVLYTVAYETIIRIALSSKGDYPWWVLTPSNPTFLFFLAYGIFYFFLLQMAIYFFLRVLGIQNKR